MSSGLLTVKSIQFAELSDSPENEMCVLHCQRALRMAPRRSWQHSNHRLFLILSFLVLYIGTVGF